MTRPASRDRRTIAIIAALTGMLLFAVLFAPDPGFTEAAPRLTTHSHSPSGARGFLETADRLGWTVVRNEEAELPPPEPGRVYAVLAPPIPLTEAETHRLLERVRGGAGLFTVLQRNTPLADSLGVRVHSRYGRVPEDTSAVCAAPRRARAAEFLRGAVFSATLDVRPRDGASSESFLELIGGTVPDSPAVAAAGFPLGDGRVGVIADPDLLTNTVLRMCRLEAGARIVALLAYVASDGSGVRTRQTLVFDEYHHGYGRQPSITRVAARFIANNPVGRMLGQVSLAAVVLLAAAAARPQPPAAMKARTRRSPMEHVNALAHAYSQISATQTVIRLLVRGLRRRLRFTASTSPARAQSDEEFLGHLAARFPALAGDLERVRRGLATRVAKNELAAIGRSIATIERTIASEQR
ncbi:MAG TPA: DUF4350 domain-containing protein [Gemmatimonadaceae bacterium]|nr:DUF4350 domain-containing protein [Gemmatimonadaceae bacterium]